MIFFSVPNLNQVPRHYPPTQFVLQDLESQGLPLDLDVELCEAHEPVVPKPVLRYGIHLCTGSQPSHTSFQTHTNHSSEAPAAGPTIGSGLRQVWDS